MKIKNIVLDIGDVICEWNPEKLIAGIFSNQEEQSQALSDTISHPDWLELDRGTLTHEEASANAQKRSSLDPQKIGKVYENTPASLVPLAGSVEAIKEAHAAGVPLYVLSNMQKPAWEFMSSKYDFWHCFTGLVLSYRINLVKPEPEIYQYLIEKNDLKPAETIFVDDMPNNIEAAKNAGLQGKVLSDRTKGGELIRSLFQ